jgi:hypothetical protein
VAAIPDQLQHLQAFTFTNAQFIVEKNGFVVSLFLAPAPAVARTAFVAHLHQTRLLYFQLTEAGT